MKPTYKLNSLDELKAMQASLNAQQQVLGEEIVSEGKTALVALPVVSLLKPGDPLKAIKIDGKINIPGKVFSYLLPLIVNRTLFRRSGFVTKIITTMIARRVGKRMGPKIAMWLIRLIERYIQNRRSKTVLVPGHVLQGNRIESKQLK